MHTKYDFESNLTSYMDINGSILKLEDGSTNFNFGSDFNRGIAWISTNGDSESRAVIDKNGKYLLRPQKIYIGTLYNGFATVSSSDHKLEGIISVKPLEVAVNLNGKYIGFDQLPVIKNGRTLVPLRAIFESLGAKVTWDGATSTITAVKGSTTISLTLGSNIAYKNGIKVSIDVPAESINGRTLVPVRFISDCFGVGVEWDANSQTVYLKN